ncbi:MAG: phosphoribosyl-ATP diphosphatase [Planctomycetota bacterium]
MPPAEQTPTPADTATARPLDALEATIRRRAQQASEKSYTSRLLTGDLSVVCGKVVEEAAELVEAAAESASGDGEAPPTHSAHLVHEAADLLYHTLVLLRRCGVGLAEVEAELERRFGVSGLEEKAARRSADSHADG